MRVVRHLRREPRPLPRVVLTLGNFDGVHAGHQAIIRRAVGEAETLGGQAVVLTFEPHPIAVLAPDRAPPLLQPLRDRLVLLREHGVAVTVLQRFTRTFAGLPPEEFVEEFLVRHLDLAHVVVGHNVSFGRGRAGSVETLAELGRRHGFAVDVVGPVAVDGEAVSSTTLRRVLREGDMRRAHRMLGRAFAMRGRVITGEQRGRTLGFPTANLYLRPRLVLPPDGVYAVTVPLDGRRVPGVLNVGVRPTFGERRRTVEVHLLDWSGDLYRRWLVVEVMERLRGEQAFAGPDALRAAIAADVARARTVLAADLVP
jgi:riboflavin kinase/FMN adenylyltransferase